MKKLTLCILFAMTFVILPVFAQVTGRLEYALKDSYDNELVFPMGKEGVLVQSFARESNNKLRYFKSEYYSTDLNLLATDSVLIDKSMYYYSDSRSGNINYTILREKGGDFTIISYNVETKKLSKFDGEYGRRGSMRDITVENGKAVFSSTEKKLDRIVIVDLATGTSKYADMQFEGVRDRNVYIAEMTLLENNIYALVNISDKKKADLFLVRIDMDGNRLSTTNLTENVNEALLNASISRAGDKFFLTGTYSRTNDLPEGIYFAELKDWKLQFIKTYNFLDLKNFTEFMGEKTKAKIERRKEKKEKAGKELKLKYRMASHPILTDGKDYFYLGEAYYPTYNTMMVNNMVNQVFAGYFYTHAILVKFDSNGNIIWDSCFPMRPKALPMYVKRFVAASLSGKNVSLLYSDKKSLVSKLFSNGDGSILKDRAVEVIETDDENEVVKKNTSNTEFWYDNNFVIFGKQTVSTKSDRRKVFFVNKYTIK